MRSRLARSFLMLATVFAAGTVGYVVIEHAGWWDAFYMTAITLTTVGYAEVFPLSTAGEVFTVLLLVCGSACCCWSRPTSGGRCSRASCARSWARCGGPA